MRKFQLPKKYKAGGKVSRQDIRKDVSLSRYELIIAGKLNECVVNVFKKSYIVYRQGAVESNPYVPLATEQNRRLSNWTAWTAAACYLIFSSFSVILIYSVSLRFAPIVCMFLITAVSIAVCRVFSLVDNATVILINLCAECGKR